MIELKAFSSEKKGMPSPLRAEEALFRLAGAEVYKELNPLAETPVCTLSFEEALVVRDEAIQVALRRLELISRLGRGFSRVLWDFIQGNRDAIKRVSEARHLSASRISLSELGWLAMEASLYDLAVFFGLADSFYYDLCFLQSGRLETFLSKGRTSKVEDTVRSKLLNAGIDVLCLRLQGELTKATTLFDTKVIPHFFEAKAATLFMKDDLATGMSDRDMGELLLIGATTHFFATSYSTALTLYRAATELLSFAEAPSRTAVASFNSAVSCNHLKKKQDVEQFMAMARHDLKRYSVPGLEASIDLFEIECCAGNAEFSRGFDLLETFFKRPDLNPTQRIVGHQTRARILIEFGHLRAADASLAAAKQLIHETGFEQFGGFQAALEIDRDTLAGREPRIPTFHSRWSLRARNLIALAEIRSLVFRGHGASAKKAYQHFLVSHSLETKSSLFMEDIESYFASTSGQPDRARTLQARLFAALEQKRYSLLKSMAKSQKSEAEFSGAFFQILELLIQSILELQRNQTSVALEFAIQAQQLANEHDLNQLGLLSAAICAGLDPHRQFEWANLLKQHSRSFIEYAEQLIGPLLKTKIFSSRWMITPSGTEVTYQAGLQQAVGLMIDKDAGIVTMDGKILNFTSQPILLKLLCEIAGSSMKGLSKEEAIQKVWEYSYDPLIHDALVYGAVRRLRAQVPIEAFDGKYRIQQGTPWACLVSEAEAQKSEGTLTARQRAILDLTQTTKGEGISRQDVVECLNTSPRTALRELTLMLELKLIERTGAGRGATYQIAKRRSL